MKEFVAMARRSAKSEDGFINGLIKGVIGCSALIVALIFMTGYVG